MAYFWSPCIHNDVTQCQLGDVVIVRLVDSWPLLWM